MRLLMQGRCTGSGKRTNLTIHNIYKRKALSITLKAFLQQEKKVISVFVTRLKRLHHKMVDLPLIAYRLAGIW